jgi:hypothetical protein
MHDDLVRKPWCPVPANAPAATSPQVPLGRRPFHAEVARAVQARNEEAPGEEGASPQGGVDSSRLTLAEG